MYTNRAAPSFLRASAAAARTKEFPLARRGPPRLPSPRTIVASDVFAGTSVAARRAFFASSPFGAVSGAAAESSLIAKQSPSPNVTVRASFCAALALLSLAGGYALGTYDSDLAREDREKNGDRVLPTGSPRGCCACEADDPTTDSSTGASSQSANQAELLTLTSKLASVVGSEHVLDGTAETLSNAKFLKGARLGRGTALCVVRPGTVSEAVRCLRAIVEAGCVVLPQGSNTGLTGGSVPRDNDRDDGTNRPTVIINTKRLDAHFPIDDGDRVVCLAGCGIATLASSIESWFPDRESHSILGSVFLNPTTAAGVAFGSGGLYLRKGPARTDRALYCRIHENGTVDIVNTLGVKGFEDADFNMERCGPTAVLDALDEYATSVKNGYRHAMGWSSDSEHGKAMASNTAYRTKVCDHNDEVSRYNADTEGEDCNRSEGKVLILATVHDTFPQPQQKRTFWVSFPDEDAALEFRRRVCLDNPEDVPVSCEYMDRDAFDIIDRSGRILVHMIRIIGTGDLMGNMWGFKLAVEGLPFGWAPGVIDKALHLFNNAIPACVPSKFMEAGKKQNHHVVLTAGEFGGGTLDRFLERMDAFAKERNVGSADGGVTVLEAETPSEIAALSAFRFAAAAAFKTYCVGEDLQGISVDYALRKNGGRAPPLRRDAAAPIKRMRYSHFGCNVVHEDLAYALDVDAHAEKMALKHTVEGEGGKLPAEHGHGTEYIAPADAKERWRKMDPLNVMNPGVGGLSSKPRYTD